MKLLTKLGLGLVLTLSVSSLELLPVQASANSLSFAVVQTPSYAEPVVTLYGQLRPAKSDIRISIQVELDGKWGKSQLATRTTKAGTWRIEAAASAQTVSVKYRAVASTIGKSTISATRSIRVKAVPEMARADPTSLIAQAGPGDRIHGMDISRWQHPGGAPIDFVKMYAAGIRFVMIKASDTKDSADAEAVKYLTLDHNAAQAVGIYTGFYHYATLPDTTDPAIVVEDASAQAQKVIWRLASLGGYRERDFSYALDLENNCVRVAGNGKCSKYTSRTLITLWAKTWLEAVAAKTGRTPFIYSYPQFLETAMVRDGSLAKYPLWLAHYGINPADPLAQPGLKNIGCFAHSWTTSNCTSLWTIWQYTSCGIAQKYGVSGARVDLNVFKGNPSTFLQMMKGTWTPEISDLLPVQEPTQLTLGATVSSTTNDPVTFLVDVSRPTQTPVITGSVKFVVDPANPFPNKPSQAATRASSGSWLLKIVGIPAGVWSGQVVYNDVSGTHATSSMPITFAVIQGQIPVPVPINTPTTTPQPIVPVDTCKNQIRN